MLSYVKKGGGTFGNNLLNDVCLKEFQTSYLLANSKMSNECGTNKEEQASLIFE